MEHGVLMNRRSVIAGTPLRSIISTLLLIVVVNFLVGDRLIASVAAIETALENESPKRRCGIVADLALSFRLCVSSLSLPLSLSARGMLMSERRETRMLILTINDLESRFIHCVVCDRRVISGVVG